MKIVHFRVVDGPNLYHSEPVVILKIDLEDWVDRPTHSFPGFHSKLLHVLPGLMQHTCSRGYPGGFFERLAIGTYLGHVIEHVALELSQVTGIGVNFGKTRYCGNESEYEIVTRFRNCEGMKECLFSAFEMVDAFLLGKEFDFEQILARIRERIQATQLGPSGEALMKAARERNIPVRRVGPDSLLQLGQGRNLRRLMTAITEQTSLVSADLVQDKQLTKEILSELEVPVPKGQVIENESEIEGALLQMDPPWVVKPFDGHHGEGVTLNLFQFDDVRSAFQSAQKFSKKVLLEQMVQGRDFRILVVGEQVVAAAERIPAQVTGDGEKTICQLIEELNLDPLRGEGHASVLTKVQLDSSLENFLNRQGLRLEDIPARGQNIFLREQANLSLGGTAIDRTDELHPETRALCERIARCLKLDICGLDVIHQDLSLPPEAGLKVLEVNAGPGLRMHLAPSQGKPRDVAGAIIDSLYPKGTTSRIPLVSVTGTNGKTTVVRLLKKIFSMKAGACVGSTSTDGIWIGHQKISSGDRSGPSSARLVLSDPKVNMAVLEVARGGILRGGLGYDWSDGMILTNISRDHLGQDGIDSVEDLVWVKSLVAERVKEGGFLVFNADDPESMRLLDEPRIRNRQTKIVLTSTQANHPEILKHVETGGLAVWCERGVLKASQADLRFEFAEVTDLPFCLQGRAIFQISNALQAAGAALCMGFSESQIREGLMSFDPNSENLGRANLYRVGKGYVFLDYGHNPEAIVAMGEMLSGFTSYQKLAFLGLPGDRSNDLLVECALQAQSQFDQIILRDDFDLRGRAPMEVPKLIQQALRECDPGSSCQIAADALMTLERTLQNLESDQILVVFYDELEPYLKLLRVFDPVPVLMIPPRLASVQETKTRWGRVGT